MKKILVRTGKALAAFALIGLVFGVAALNVHMTHKVQRAEVEKAADRHLTLGESQAVDKLERMLGHAVNDVSAGVLGEASAADVLQCVLTSTDAGPTNTCQLVGNQQTYEIWCQIPACYKTDKLVGPAGANTGTIGDGGINCAFDVPAYVYNGTSLANQNTAGPQGNPSLPRFRFGAGVHTGIWALAADAGNPSCNVSLVQGGN